VQKWLKVWVLVGDAFQHGASIALAIPVGIGMGYLLDRLFGTFPYLSILFFFFGIGAAVRNVQRAIRHEARVHEQEKTVGKDDG
jgi:ATP synthase protein I